MVYESRRRTHDPFRMVLIPFNDRLSFEARPCFSRVRKSLRTNERTLNPIPSRIYIFNRRLSQTYPKVDSVSNRYFGWEGYKVPDLKKRLPTIFSVNHFLVLKEEPLSRDLSEVDKS